MWNLQYASPGPEENKKQKKPTYQGFYENMSILPRVVYKLYILKMLDLLI